MNRQYSFFSARTRCIIFLVLCGALALLFWSRFRCFAERQPVCQMELQIKANELSEIGSIDLQILRVKPHKLTETECAAFAKLLFGDVTFYETDFDPVMTKTDAEAKTQMLEKLSEDEIIRDIYGTDELLLIKNVIKETIDGLIKNQASCEHNDSRKICSWEFKPQSYYASNIPGATDEDDANKLIMAYVDDRALSHKLWATSRDGPDFHIQSIYVYPNSEFWSPFDIETLYMIRYVCGNGKPSEIEFENVLQQAEMLVGSVGIGEWTIIDSNIECYKYWSNKESPLYVINVAAVPCFGGIKALHVDQLEELRGQNALSNYYYSEFLLTFSSSGELLEAALTSPIDVVAVVDSNVDAIDPQKALSSLPSYINAWAVTLLKSEGFSDDVGYRVKAVVDGVDWGYARVDTKDESGDFLLVPAIQFRGDYALMYNKKVVYSYRETFGKDYGFTLISLTDGTLIY